MCQVKEHSAFKYPAKHFINSHDQAALLGVINQNPLATVLYLDDTAELHISHLPFHFDKNTVNNVKGNENEDLVGVELMAHASNKHPLAQQLKAAQGNKSAANITLVFHGEDDYISPNDVSGEHSSMQKVPTWNYAKVHVCGHVAEVVNDNEKYQQMLASTDYFEQIKVQQGLTSTDKNTAWSLTEAPSQAIDSMLKAITVFKLTISGIEGRFKLSQNKSMTLKAEIAEQVAMRNKTFLSQQIRTL